MIILVDLEAIMRILSVGEARESGFESNQQHEFWVALRSLLFVFIPRDGLLEVMGRHCIWYKRNEGDTTRWNGKEQNIRVTTALKASRFTLLLDTECKLCPLFATVW